MMLSCVQGDLYDDMYDANLNSMINRKKITKDYGNNHYNNHSSVNFFIVSENVLSSTGCALECILYSTDLKKKYVTGFMQQIQSNISTFPASSIPTVIDMINNDKGWEAFSCTNVNTTNLQNGDIAVTNVPLSLTADINGQPDSKTSQYGHAFIVKQVITVGTRKRFEDSDSFLYCNFDQYYIQGGYRITKNQQH